MAAFVLCPHMIRREGENQRVRSRDRDGEREAGRDEGREEEKGLGREEERGKKRREGKEGRGEEARFSYKTTNPMRLGPHPYDLSYV